MSATTESDSTAKAHGMDGTLVEPDWPPLTLAELRALLAQFPDLGEPIDILSVARARFPPRGSGHAERSRNGQPSSSSAITARCAIAKGCSRSIAFLRICSRTARRFRASSLPRPAKPRSKPASGPTRCTKFPPGVDLYEDAISWTPFRSAAHAHSAGQALARLHLAAQRFRCSAPQAAPARRQLHHLRRARSRREHGALSRRAPLARQPRSRSRLRGAGTRSSRAVSRRACAASARAHAALDAQRSARLQSFLERSQRPDARATAIIDFGLADRTNAVHDIAHAIERNIVEWLALVNDPAHPDDVPIHLRSSRCASRWLRIRSSALERRIRRARAHDRSLPRGVRAL